MNNDLIVADITKAKGLSGIISSVDVLCTNNTNKMIAIEMQG